MRGDAGASSRFSIGVKIQNKKKKREKPNRGLLRAGLVYFRYSAKKAEPLPDMAA